MCLSRVGKYYETIWLTTLLLDTLIKPSVQLLMCFPVVVHTRSRFQNFLGFSSPSTAERLDTLVAQSQETIADVLVSITMGVSLCCVHGVRLFFHSQSWYL